MKEMSATTINLSIAVGSSVNGPHLLYECMHGAKCSQKRLPRRLQLPTGGNRMLLLLRQDDDNVPSLSELVFLPR